MKSRSASSPGSSVPPRELSCLSVRLSPLALESYGRQLRLAPAEAFGRLAHTLALALDAGQEPAVTLVARGGGDTPSVLAWIGSCDAALRNRIEVQARALEAACASLRYVHPEDVEGSCARLAAALVHQVGRDEIEHADFVAIPNGGLAVLDRLMRHLGPRPAVTDRDSILVVIDDCAISGARFRQFLAGQLARRIVFAPLFSPPALRQAIRTAEPRVLHCLSGEDVREISAAASAEHQERRRNRLAREECFWLGATERLCFPWNEPDQVLWNPGAGRPERAWRIVPPELCSKNRPAPGALPIPVQLQAPGTGSLRPSARALFAEAGEEGEEIVLCDLESSESFRLAGVASDLWRGFLRTGDPEATIAWLRGLYDVAEEDLRRDVQRFFETLGERGLIVPFQEAEAGDLRRSLPHRPPLPFHPGVSQQAPLSPLHADPQGGHDSTAAKKPAQAESLGQAVDRQERAARRGPGRPEAGGDGARRSALPEPARREPALDTLEGEPVQTDPHNMEKDPGLGKNEAFPRRDAPPCRRTTLPEGHCESL